MGVLNVEKMDSSSKMDLRDVLWWMSIKDACRLEVQVIVRFSKEGCISIAIRGRPFRVARKHG
jgi:hypothetical protein